MAFKRPNAQTAKTSGVILCETLDPVKPQHNGVFAHLAGNRDVQIMGLLIGFADEIGRLCVSGSIQFEVVPV
jgi:hypothetical protein